MTSQPVLFFRLLYKARQNQSKLQLPICDRFITYPTLHRKPDMHGVSYRLHKNKITDCSMQKASFVSFFRHYSRKKKDAGGFLELFSNFALA